MSLYLELKQKEDKLLKYLGKLKLQTKRGKKRKTCAYCGKRFYPYVSSLKWISKKYCSHRCVNKAKYD